MERIYHINKTIGEKLKIRQYNKDCNQIISRLFLYPQRKLDKKKKSDLSQIHPTELAVLTKNICPRTRKYSKMQFPRSVL